jgi:hypothetical protein
VKTDKCYGGRPHLPGIRRASGELVCARCLAQLEPPDSTRAWGMGKDQRESGCLERLRPLN